MSAKSSKKYSKKQLQIMEQALSIFAQKGFDGASVRDIAKASNINIAMISYYFGSKLQLLEAIFDHMNEEAKDLLADIMFERDLDPIQRFDKIIDGYFAYVADHPNFTIIITKEQFNTSLPFLKNVVNLLRNRTRSLLEAGMREAVRQGYFNEKVSLSTVASIVMGTVHQLIYNPQFLSLSNNQDSTEKDLYQSTIINKTLEELKYILKLALVKV